MKSRTIEKALDSYFKLMNEIARNQATAVKSVIATKAKATKPAIEKSSSANTTKQSKGELKRKGNELKTETVKKKISAYLDENDSITSSKAREIAGIDDTSLTPAETQTLNKLRKEHKKKKLSAKTQEEANSIFSNEEVA